MTFDIAQMIADREAGTPGEWTAHQGFPHIVCPVDHFTRPYGGSVDKNRDRNNYAHIIAMADHDRHGRGDNHANARRIARVPAMEAEIIRLTARVAEYDRVCADLVEHWDSTDWVNKPHTVEKIAAIRAALSTHTEEPKT